MMSQTKTHKILLAIDPLEVDLRPNQEALRDLRFWTDKLASSVEAVYILSDPDGDIRVNETFSLAKVSLKNGVNNLHLDVPVGSRVLMDKSNSRRHSVKTFIRYAEVTHADLIFVFSHGRRGISRLLLGSFAETLLADSPVPVLFMGTEPDQNRVLNRILFVTDFSEISEKAYRVFLKQLRPLNAEILIYHALAPVASNYDYSFIGLGASYFPETDPVEQRELWDQEKEHFLKLAQDQGLRARMVKGANEEVRTSEEIKEIADREQLVLVGLASTTIGKLASELFSTQKYGVWLFGPTAIDQTVSANHQSSRIPFKTIDRGLDQNLT